MASLTLDAGALIAYERADPRVREILAAAFARGIVPTVPAVVVAEVWRGDPKDARVARLLQACNVEPLNEKRARDGGVLRHRVPGATAIDACVAIGAHRRGDVLVTSDARDMRLLLGPSAQLLDV